MQDQLSNPLVMSEYEYVLKTTKGRARLAILSFYFIQGLGFASWASRIPDIKTSLSMSEAALGTVLFAPALGQLAAMPVSGAWVAKYGSIRMLAIAMVLYCFILVTLGLAVNSTMLFVSLFFFGLCSNFLNIAVNTQGLRMEEIYGRSIMSSFHGGWSFACALSSVFALSIAPFRIEPYIHFIIIAIVMLGLMVFRLKDLIPDPPKKNTEQKETIFKKPELLLVQLGLIGFFGMCSEGAMFDWSGVYFKEVVHAPEMITVMGFTIVMTFMAIGRFLTDKLSVRIGKKRVLQLGGILIFTGLMISVLFPYLIPSAIGFMIVGFGISSIVPTIYSIAGRNTKGSPSIALTIVSSVSFFGFLLGPPIIGYIAELTNLRYSYAVVSMFGLSITLLVSLIKSLKHVR